jgi:hypothetical protein
VARWSGILLFAVPMAYPLSLLLGAPAKRHIALMNIIVLRNIFKR